MINNIEIITVNYNTPDLINNLIKSVRDVECNYQIRIIDGSDKEPFKSEIIEVCKKYNNIILQQQGWNIHHGRGMDYAMNTSSYDWVLFIDSDSQIKAGLLNVLSFNKPYMGFSMQVNDYGMNVDKGILYLHPQFLLVNVKHYRINKCKFIHHGAPALQIMKDTKNEDKNIINDKYLELFIRGGRGTINRFGLNL
jgi:hypothetical protein